MSALPALLLSVFLPPSAFAAVPATPNVTPLATSTTSIQWSWPLAAGTTGYRVLSSTGGGNISGNLPSSTSFFFLTSLSANTSTAVTIEAFNDSGTSDAPLSPRYTLAAQPTGTALLGRMLDSIGLSWNANGNTSTTTYNVDYWLIFGGSVTVSTQSSTFDINPLTTNNTYFLAVQAQNGDGVGTAFDLSVTTFLPPLSPFVIDATATISLGVSSITWVWTPSTGAVTYQVKAATGGAISPLLPASLLTYTQTGLSTNTVHTSFIQANNAAFSTATANFTAATLAAPTSSLTLLALNGNTETVSWNTATNPPGTTYIVSWWTVQTATVAVYAPQGPPANVAGLFGGGTVFFTVQAVNVLGSSTAFDATYFNVVPSTFFAQGVSPVAAGTASTATFVIPSGFVLLQISSQAFQTAVNISISAPAPAAVPAVPGPFTALPVPINLLITATDANGNAVQPLVPVPISVQYGSIAFGSQNTTNLVLARFDPLHGAWVPLITSRDPRAYALTGLTDHFSLFAVLGLAAPADLASATIGPNPYRPLVNPGSLVAFRNLPARTRLRIYTYLGELLAELHADGAGLANWDGRNASGSMVASGVYLVFLESEGSKRMMRLIIER